MRGSKAIVMTTSVVERLTLYFTLEEVVPSSIPVRTNTDFLKLVLVSVFIVQGIS